MIQIENPRTWKRTGIIEKGNKEHLKIQYKYNPEFIKCQVEYYFSLNLKPIPIIAYGKNPEISGWNKLDPRSLWTNYRQNIGLVLGEGLIVIDADNRTTEQYFDALFENPLKVKTKRGGHYYFRCDFPDIGKGAKSILDKGNGFDGEFRLDKVAIIAPPSYVSAAAYKKPSITTDHLYEVVLGSFDNIPHLCPDYLMELILQHTNYTNKPLEIKTITKSNPVEVITTLNIPVKRREVNNIIRDKIEWLKTATKGQGYTSNKVSYPSRSEVYYSIISPLIRFGYNRNEIYDLLKGVYKDRRYFEGAYTDTIDDLESNELLATFNELYDLEHPTKSEQLIYRALLSLGYQFLRATISTSNAELRRFTGIKHYMTIKNALIRLEKQNLITINGKKITILTSIDTNSMYIDHSGDVRVNDDIVESLNLDYVLSKNTTKILGIMQENGKMFQQDMMEISNLSERMTSYHLKKLQNFGIIYAEKHGRKKLYHLTENYETKLYELASDHMNENHLKIAAQQARYYEYLKESNMYQDLKKQHGPDKALEIVKKIVGNKD